MAFDWPSSPAVQSALAPSNEQQVLHNRVSDFLALIFHRPRDFCTLPYTRSATRSTVLRY
ncbi:hypothetical protein OUZ56_007659 [Daphnia magna]|uniref:Uncharacterized protein n=1 Tax=Daphnia magna TaxID=35525 RepID=A0ABR0AAY7_9CRUS|nr:hypothetical protein OUZ56_007659 [Daphnia magna]